MSVIDKTKLLSFKFGRITGSSATQDDIENELKRLTNTLTVPREVSAHFRFPKGEKHRPFSHCSQITVMQ